MIAMTSLLLLNPTFTHASQSSIKLLNNGYSGIVVSFSPDIQSSQRESMLREMMVSKEMKRVNPSVILLYLVCR